MTIGDRGRVCAVSALALGMALFALAAAPRRASAAPHQKLPAGIKVDRDVAYDVHGKSNMLDVYYPEHASAPVPLVIWVHGGAWWAGSKGDGQPAIRLLAHGYAIASINYRLSQEAIYPAQIEDCKAAVRFLRANAKKYHVDPDHIGVWAPRPAAIWWRCWAPPAMSRAWRGRGPIRESPAGCRRFAICLAPPISRKS